MMSVCECTARISQRDPIILRIDGLCAVLTKALFSYPGETRMSTAIIMRTLLICLCSLLAATNPASAVDVRTPAEVIVGNGTTGILQCSFKSEEVVSSLVAVSWTFRPSGSESVPYSILYYGNGKSFPSARYQKRVQFIGDLDKNDASIHLLRVGSDDEGTYFCDVKNPPDVSGAPSRTELKVALEACQDDPSSRCPDPVVPDHGGLACVTVNGYRYCKPMCNKGFDFKFLRRSRLYERCGTDTRFSWQTAYVGGNRLVECIESSIEVSGGPTAYFPQDCLTSQSSNHSTIQTFIAELKEQGVAGATHACLVCA